MVLNDIKTFVKMKKKGLTIKKIILKFKKI